MKRIQKSYVSLFLRRSAGAMTAAAAAAIVLCGNVAMASGDDFKLFGDIHRHVDAAPAPEVSSWLIGVGMVVLIVIEVVRRTRPGRKYDV